MISIGIDPGASGAVAAINHSGHAVVLDLPHKDMPFPGLGKRRVDVRALVLMLRTLIPPNDVAVIGVERVGVMGSGVNAIQSVASLSGSIMLILGALDIIRVDPVIVQPRAWKAHFGLHRGKDEKASAWKARSREVARSLYPKTDEAWKLAKHDGRAEALLLAHWIKAQHS